ncbi:MAG TPA: histidine kinase [Ornithinibacter sp.]|nr:histidine kinase [Ornithinibacter sp.]
MTRFSRILGLDASAAIRLAFAVLSLVLARLTHSLIDVLPWLLLVVALDLVVVALDAMPILRRGVLDTLALTLLAVAAAATGAGYALTGQALGATLLVLIPAYHAGMRFGRLGVMASSLAACAGFALSVWVFPAYDDVHPEAVLWLASAIGLGVLGTWNRSFAEEQSAGSDPAAREAIELIRRLQDLSGQMSTGLDAPASATLVLDLLAAEVPSTRSAVLVTNDAEHLVPVALRGSTRAPWHIAEHVAHLLRSNPASWQPTEVAFVDELGRRRALVVPFDLGNGSTTVLVAERPDGDSSFSEAERRVARDVTRRIAPTLQAGLLFGRLRQFASIEERNRIARDIHDGIAQELAALGYQVDALRAQAGPPGIPMRDGLDRLREQLSEAMHDLRLHITDLRVAERPGSGLGSVLGAAVQSFGSVTGVRTTVTMSEGQRRLDPRVEILIHRLVMDILADAQACGARNAWVTLATSVAGPACVDVAHDGDPRTARRSFKDPALEGLDATLFARTEPNGRTTVNLTVQEPAPVGAFRSTA